MSVPKVRLYIRVRLPNGSRPFLDPVFSANHKLREGWAVHQGTPQRFDDAVYHLRYLRDGKRVWERLTKDAQQALAAKGDLELRLQAAARGIGLAPVADISESSRSTTAGRSLAGLAETYLDEIKASRKRTTHKVYAKGLQYFQESCKQDCIDTIDRTDMLRFRRYLTEKQHLSGSSSATHFRNVLSFLKAHDVATGIKKNDWPRFVEPVPEVYEQADLDRLFSVCSEQEKLYFRFYLMTGMRLQEAMHTYWSDIDFVHHTVRVSAKAAYEWTPKTWESREIPIPDCLVEALKVAKANALPRCPLIFPTSNGKPKTDFWDLLRERATDAGLNPDDFWIHKFRATFATWHLWKGIDIRTVQSWLGHKSLASTMRYLRPARGEEIQRKVNATFATEVAA